jgi:hypothetical protein
MLTTVMTVAICVVCTAAIAALWDAARRYIEMRRFNQHALDHLTSIEREQEKLGAQVQAISGKLNMAAAANGTRLNRVGRS